MAASGSRMPSNSRLRSASGFNVPRARHLLGQPPQPPCRAAVSYTHLDVYKRQLPEIVMSLRAEQWMENPPEAPADARAAVKQRFRDAFYTDTPEWKARIVEQGLQAARQALAGLSEA